MFTVDNVKMLIVSIHAPRVRCDFRRNDIIGGINGFNPRTSCEVRHDITSLIFSNLCFNPRTSCEVRPGYDLSTLTEGAEFQSTHLV